MDPSHELEASANHAENSSAWQGGHSIKRNGNHETNRSAGVHSLRCPTIRASRPALRMPVMQWDCNRGVRCGRVVRHD
jgi:hypothetical protein